MVLIIEMKNACMGHFFAFKAILHFSPRSDAMRGLLEIASHGCGMNRLSQRLLRMDRAPGFGCSSRTAMGREAASDEDRCGLCCVMLSSISRRGIFQMNLFKRKRRNKRWFIDSLFCLLNHL
jgi:hypothetical protein